MNNLDKYEFSLVISALSFWLENPSDHTDMTAQEISDDEQEMQDIRDLLTKLNKEFSTL